MRNVALGVVGTLGLVLFGCSPAPSNQTELGSNHSYIFHGTPDTTHPAVVALLSQMSECSGTIIKVSGNTGYVLTAAHCLAAGDLPQVAVQANDYNDPNAITYNVTATKAHPSYNGDTYDFGIVTITGTGPDTPVLPAMTKDIDNLAVGSTVDYVGYGITENTMMNSLRRHVTGVIDGEVTPLQLKYSQTKSGPCEGDSGGPSLSTIGSQEYVAGVTSYGDQACVQFGVSGRVSGVYDSFIKPILDNTMPPAQTCQECGNAVTAGVGTCSSTVKDCQNDADCAALIQCFNACASGDNACYQGCATAHKTGTQVYLKINTCICDTGCKAECASDSSCQQATGGMCAYTFPDATCTTCADGMCCDVQKACNSDAACNACVTTQGAPGCDTNANLKALTACLQTSCQQPCASILGTPAACAYTFPDATCATCADGMCCDAQKACADNANCNACVTTGMGTNCNSDPLVTAMFSCLQTSCKDPCASLFSGGGGAGAGGSGAGGGMIGTGGTSAGGMASGGTSAGGTSPFGGGGSNAGGSNAAGSGTAGTSPGAGGTGTGTAGKGGTASSAGGSAGSTSSAGGSTGDAGGAANSDTPAAAPQDTSSSSGCSVASPRGDAGGLSASLLLGFAALLGAGRRRRQNRG